MDIQPKDPVASKSPKLAKILDNHNNYYYKSLCSDTHNANQRSFRIIIDFCHGIDPEFTSSNVIRLTSLAESLEMTEDHSPGNFLSRALTYIDTKVLPFWNETVNAYRSIQPEFCQHMKKLGVLDALLNSIGKKASMDPFLLMSGNFVGMDGELILVSEDLTSLNDRLFVMAITSVIGSGGSDKQITECLYRYMKNTEIEPKRVTQVLENVVELLPTTADKPLLPVGNYLEILRLALMKKASVECVCKLESLIADQLANAKLDDLLLLHSWHESGVQTNYNIECVKRIVKRFIAKNTGKHDNEDNLQVFALVKGFLWRVVAMEPNLKFGLLSSLLCMMLSLKQDHDGYYQIIGTYLKLHDKSKELGNEVRCGIIDLSKLPCPVNLHKLSANVDDKPAATTQEEIANGNNKRGGDSHHLIMDTAANAKKRKNMDWK